MSEQSVEEKSPKRCRMPAAHYDIDGDTYDYFSSPHPVDADVWQRLRSAVIRYLNIRSGMHIVDVGSGGGWLTRHMNDKSVSVTSIDLSFKNVKRVTAENNSTGLLADAATLPFSNESVDAVIASEVIEHLNDPEKAIAEFIRILKPGGRVIITTPYKEDIKQHVCIHCNKLTPANAHLHSFDESRLVTMFSHGGAHEIFYRRIGNKAFIFSRLSYFLRWLPFSIWSFIDQCTNIIIKKPAHIIVCGIKQGDR